MFKKAFISYCLTILIFSSIIFVPQFLSSDDGDGTELGGLIIVLSALGMGFMAAIPTLASWMPLWLLLEKLRIRPRWRAVLAAGPTAFVSAYAVNYFFREIDSSFGRVSASPNMQEIMTVVFVAISVVFLVWTLSPSKVDQE